MHKIFLEIFWKLNKKLNVLLFYNCKFIQDIILLNPYILYNQGRRIKLNFPSTAYLSSPHSIPLSVVLD